jgi:hypothetical protein
MNAILGMAELLSETSLTMEQQDMVPQSRKQRVQIPMTIRYSFTPDDTEV